MCCKASSTGESSWVYIAQTSLFPLVFRCQTCHQTYQLLGKSLPCWASLLGGYCCRGHGGEGGLERAAIASYCPPGSGSSCCTKGYTVLLRGSTRREFPQLQPAAWNKPAARFSSARAWLCSGWQPVAGVVLGSLCGLRREENSTHCKKAMCWKDWQQWLGLFLNEKQPIEARRETGFAARQCAWLFLLASFILVLSNVVVSTAYTQARLSIQHKPLSAFFLFSPRLNLNFFPSKILSRHKKLFSRLWQRA